MSPAEFQAFKLKRMKEGKMRTAPTSVKKKVYIWERRKEELS